MTEPVINDRNESSEAMGSSTQAEGPPTKAPTAKPQASSDAAKAQASSSDAKAGDGPPKSRRRRGSRGGRGRNRSGQGGANRADASADGDAGTAGDTGEARTDKPPAERSTSGQALYGITGFGIGGSIGIALAGLVVTPLGTTGLFVFEAAIAAAALPAAARLVRSAR